MTCCCLVVVIAALLLVREFPIHFTHSLSSTNETNEKRNIEYSRFSKSFPGPRGTLVSFSCSGEGCSIWKQFTVWADRKMGIRSVYGVKSASLAGHGTFQVPDWPWSRWNVLTISTVCTDCKWLFRRSVNRLKLTSQLFREKGPFKVTGNMFVGYRSSFWKRFAA